MSKSGLTEEQATAIWDILMRHCQANPDYDYGFVRNQSTEYITEWRFMGALGFGGKFYRSISKRPDGTYGELWFVTCYREDETPETRAMMDSANEALWNLFKEYNA